MTKPQGDIGNLLKNLPNSATAHPRGKQITVANVYGIFFFSTYGSEKCEITAKSLIFTVTHTIFRPCRVISSHRSVEKAVYRGLMFVASIKTTWL